MKKNLLFLASLVMSVSVFAQWTKPVPTQFVDMADDGETTQYLYNAKAGGFLAGHNDYNTRASIAEKGDQVRMKALEGGTWNLGLYPATYVSKNAWLYVSCNSFDAQWVDAPNAAENESYPGTDQWVVEKQANGTYKFTNKACEANPGTWGMAEIYNGEKGNTRLYIKDSAAKYSYEDNGETLEADAFSGEFYDEWQFVTVEEYESLLDKLSQYEAAMALKAAIDAAKADHPDIDLSKQEAVYNNTASTVEELNAAEKEIGPAVVDFLKDKASVDNPVNFTTSIINPTFDEIGNFTGWLGTAFGAGGTTSTNAEHYGKTFDTYQDIEGLPAGIYMVSCNGYTRYQNASADYAAWAAGSPSETKIYLSSETNGQFFTPIKHVSAGGSYTSIHSQETTVTTNDGQTLYCPNTMAAATVYFHETDDPKRYYNEAFGPLADNETLRIGVINQKATGSDWSIFDDFQLFYYGDNLDAYQLWGAKVKENNVLNFDGVYYGAPEKALYEKTMETLTSASTKEDIAAAVLNVDAVIDSVAVSRANYLAYVNALKDAMEWLIQADEQGIFGDDVDKLSDYLQADSDDGWNFPHGVAKSILDYEADQFEGKLSAAEIAEETTYVQDLKQTAIKNGLSEGGDCTNMIVNASFKDGFTGWTKTAGNVGGLASFPNVECYETVVEISQVVNDVPDGIYSLSCKAFERPGANGNYDGSEESIVYLFMNDFQTQVQNICQDALPEDQAEDQVNCYIGGGGGAWPYDYNVSGFGWVPNSMDGASYAFQAGRYEQKVYGLVEGGTMKIGLTSNGQTLGSQCWVLWADFKLTYEGKSVTALKNVLPTFIESLEKFVDENSSSMTTPSTESATAIITAANQAIDDEDAEAMWTALTSINATLLDAKANVAAVAALNTAKDALDEAINQYGETASQDAINNYYSVAEKAENFSELTTAEVEALTEEINAAASALKIPAYENASDETPVDFTALIVNSTFDTIGDFTGWSDGFGAGGTTSTNAECYNKNFDVHQDIVGLPAGTYQVACYGYYRQGSAENDYNNTQTEDGTPAYNAIIYALGENADTCSAPIMSICAGMVSVGLGGDTSNVGSGSVVPNTMAAATYWFEAGYYAPTEKFNAAIVKVGEDGKLRIGVKKDVTISTDWAIFDNFTLTYYGTNSAKEPSVGTDIASIAPAVSAAPAGIYTISGAKVATLQKGINIVRLSDGTVKKVLVK
ncbi:MAG: hypothetical protein IJ635_09010 [Bacteroidaceae bacterium]|nr:hypothetical protein [Bacteroidaceae bacterium]